MTDSSLKSDERALSLEANKYIAELLDILKSNGMKEDAKGLADIVGCVSAMERDINKAISELTAMRKELSAMHEEQNHPIKTMLSKAADGLMTRLRAAQKQIQAIKEKIIAVCKKTVEEIKDKGIIAANGVVGALNIKADLEYSRGSMYKTIDFCEKQIEKIESASTEFHTAGRAVKNFGRALIGKEPIPEIKPNGSLARFIQRPFRGEISRQRRYLRRNGKALDIVYKLEKSAELRAERTRPSVYGDMDRIKAEIDRSIPTIPRLEKLKTAEESL